MFLIQYIETTTNNHTNAALLKFLSQIQHTTPSSLSISASWLADLTENASHSFTCYLKTNLQHLWIHAIKMCNSSKQILTFLSRILETDCTSARNEWISEADSLYFLSWLCIDPISSGNEETRDLNSAIICFLPEVKPKAAHIIKPKSNKMACLKQGEGGSKPGSLASSFSLFSIIFPSSIFFCISECRWATLKSETVTDLWKISAKSFLMYHSRSLQVRLSFSTYKKITKNWFGRRAS